MFLTNDKTDLQKKGLKNKWNIRYNVIENKKREVPQSLSD